MSPLYYLISTLPSLKFGEKPPFSGERFIFLCSSCLGAKDTAFLSSLNLVPGVSSSEEKHKNSTAEKWFEWELCLRNRIAKLRQAPFQTDPSSFQKTEKDYFSDIDKAVQEAFSCPDPLSREKFIDSIRWKKLDSLESGHIFDFDKLVVYRLKLLILEKWNARNADSGNSNFNGVLSSIMSKEKNKTVAK